ncbi:MAG: anti-sigma factor [Alphaproteobacteria bacterium]
MPEHRTQRGTHRDLPFNEETLCAYADGALDTADRIEVEARLADDPDAAARVVAWRRDSETLHRIYDPVLLEPLPPVIDELRRNLQARLAAPPPPRVRPRRFAVAALAAVVVAVCAGAGVRLLWPVAPTEAMFALLADGTPPSPQAVATGTAGGTGVLPAANPDRPAAKGDFAPDLAALGFTLISTRVLPGDALRTIELEYENTEGRRVSLYYTPNDKETKLGLSLTQEGPVSLLFWHADGRSYAMIGEVPRDMLLKLGRAVSADLADTAAPPALNTPGKLPADPRGLPAPGGEAAPPRAVPDGLSPRTDAPAAMPPVLHNSDGGAVAPQDASGRGPLPRI